MYKHELDYYFLHIPLPLRQESAIIDSNPRASTLSTLLKGTSAEFSPSLLGDLNQQPFSYWLNTPNR
jgi:hypothetical protein